MNDPAYYDAMMNLFSGRYGQDEHEILWAALSDATRAAVASVEVADNHLWIREMIASDLQAYGYTLADISGAIAPHTFEWYGQEVLVRGRVRLNVAWIHATFTHILRQRLAARGVALADYGQLYPLPGERTYFSSSASECAGKPFHLLATTYFSALPSAEAEQIIAEELAPFFNDAKIREHHGEIEAPYASGELWGW